VGTRFIPPTPWHFPATAFNHLLGELRGVRGLGAWGVRGPVVECCLCFFWWGGGGGGGVAGGFRGPVV
jgi:hypothetical protein